jgi:hypothetical protein
VRQREYTSSRPSNVPCVAASNVCPVCGYPGLYEPPWSGDGASDEICPSCGMHFGYDDFAEDDTAAREAMYTELRQRWHAAGRPWFSPVRTQPSD